MNFGLQGLFKCVKASRSPQISYLLFADYCVLFREVTLKGACILQKNLSIYESCSGQCVSAKKSTISFSSNTAVSRSQQVAMALGMRHSNNPEKYLGLSNVVGHSKNVSFQALKDRMKSKVDNWSDRFLSRGGKEVSLNRYCKQS